MAGKGRVGEKLVGERLDKGVVHRRQTRTLMTATRKLWAGSSPILRSVLLGVLVSLRAVGNAASNERPPYRTAVRCSVSEAGEPELQVRDVG